MRDKSTWEIVRVLTTIMNSDGDLAKNTNLGSSGFEQVLARQNLYHQGPPTELGQPPTKTKSDVPSEVLIRIRTTMKGN